jgi:uncharacterized coiled-coil DUF342 family protein
MDSETAEEIKRHFDLVTEGLRELRTEIHDIKRHSDVVAESLRTEIRDVKRHSDVIAEGLRSEIRTVVEGVVGLREEFSLEFKRVYEEFGEVRALIRVSYGDLDRRVQSLEKGKPS